VSRIGLITCLCAVVLSTAGLAACSDGEQAGTSAKGPPVEREVVSSRSAPFHKYSGRGPAKLRLAEFGTEARSSDRLEVQVAVNAFLLASDNGQWERACPYASEILLSQIRQIARNSKRTPEPSCGEVLQELASPPGKEAASPLAPQGIASLRIKEGPGGGFALFHGSDGADHWITVRREAGGWKILSPAAQAFE
jgi:hypothetical protein